MSVRAVSNLRLGFLMRRSVLSRNLGNSSDKLFYSSVAVSTTTSKLKPPNHLQNSHFKHFNTSASHLAKDYYQLLGVSRDSTSKDIKKAYYQLAKKYHPDTNKGDKEAQKKFQEVSEAYECLSDDSRRKQYDAFGHAGSGGGGGANPFDGFAGGAWNFRSSIDPEELFRTIFGDKSWSSGGVGGASTNGHFDFGAPVEYQMKLSFLDAARGVEKELNVSILDSCPTCKGGGSEPGTTQERCPQCNGSGMETVTTGPFMMRSTCRRCHGKGVYNKSPCKECRGAGQTKQRKKITVPVPAGIEDGQTVRMAVGSKEVFITFRVEASDYFRRQGSDIHTDAKLSLAQAALGGVIRVQGVYEDLTVQIPSGTGSHTRMRVSGKGLKKVSGYGYGDHYVHLKIDVPKKLNDKQRALIRAYAEMESDTPGTITGITYTKDGHKIVIEDPDGLVAELREALDPPQNGENKGAQS